MLMFCSHVQVVVFPSPIIPHTNKLILPDEVNEPPLTSSQVHISRVEQVPLMGPLYYIHPMCEVDPPNTNFLPCQRIVIFSENKRIDKQEMMLSGKELTVWPEKSSRLFSTLSVYLIYNITY